MACLDTRERGHQEQQGWRRSIFSFVTRTFEAVSRYRERSSLHTMVPASSFHCYSRNCTLSLNNQYTLCASSDESCS